MNKNISISAIKEKKERIIENLLKYYEEIYLLNCEEVKLEYNFPENYKNKKFSVENENGKTLIFGKCNLKKSDLYNCEIWAYQLKRNGNYYTHPEHVSMDKFSKFTWIE